MPTTTSPEEKAELVLLLQMSVNVYLRACREGREGQKEGKKEERVVGSGTLNNRQLQLKKVLWKRGTPYGYV